MRAGSFITELVDVACSAAAGTGAVAAAAAAAGFRERKRESMRAIAGCSASRLRAGKNKGRGVCLVRMLLTTSTVPMTGMLGANTYGRFVLLYS